MKYFTSRLALFPFLLVAGTACDGPPARLVAGIADTVIVNNERPVKLPVQVLDSHGSVLPDSAVRFRWNAGMPVSVSPTGVVTCTGAGDATVHASLGSLSTNLLLRCRPVTKVLATRMMNLVVGGPSQDLPFEALDVDGKSVTLLTGQVTIGDSTIASVQGTRVRAVSTGQTGIEMRVGNRKAFTQVLAYKLASTPEGIRPGEHVAVNVHLLGGEMRSWHLAASRENYFIAMLPDGDEQSMPRLTILGAACSPGLGPYTFFCLARTDAKVIVYHPRDVDPERRLSGALAVWRQSWRE